VGSGRVRWGYKLVLAAAPDAPEANVLQCLGWVFKREEPPPPPGKRKDAGPQNWDAAKEVLSPAPGRPDARRCGARCSHEPSAQLPMREAMFKARGAARRLKGSKCLLVTSGSVAVDKRGRALVRPGAPEAAAAALAALSGSKSGAPPPSLPRTNRTSLVPPRVLSGHAAQYAAAPAPDPASGPTAARWRRRVLGGVSA
jgi:hypothetical protein